MTYILRVPSPPNSTARKTEDQTWTQRHRRAFESWAMAMVPVITQHFVQATVPLPLNPHRHQKHWWKGRSLGIIPQFLLQRAWERSQCTFAMSSWVTGAARGPAWNIATAQHSTAQNLALSGKWLEIRMFVYSHGWQPVSFWWWRGNGGNGNRCWNPKQACLITK